MLSLMPLSDSSNDILARPNSSGKEDAIFLLCFKLSLCLNSSSIFFWLKVLLFLIFTFFFFCFFLKSFFSGVSVKISDLLFHIFLFCLLSRAFGSGKMSPGGLVGHITKTQFRCLNFFAYWRCGKRVATTDILICWTRSCQHFSKISFGTII